MYFLDPAKKADPERRWALPDRIFFGYGACHILAGTYLREINNSNYYPVWVKPRGGLEGNHIFVTDGETAFDFHGYCLLDSLVQHHRRGWGQRFENWSADTVPVDFDLLDTTELNKRGMRGPDQYLGNPIRRASKFLLRFNHK